MSLVVSHNPSIILLSESRQTEDIHNSELYIENYSIVRCDSRTRYTGGVLLYIKNNIHVSVFKTFLLDANYWCKIIKIKILNTKWLIGCLYHSPSASHATFLEDFVDICDTVFSNNNKCLLIGDFNLDYLSLNSYYVNKIKDVFNTYGITQLITEPTRCTYDTATLVDFVLTNTNDVTSIVHICPRIADHYIISVNFANRNLPDIKYCKKYRNLNEQNILNINLSLISYNWSLNSVDIDNIYDEISNICGNAVNKFAQVQSYTVTNKLPWFDQEVFNKMKVRDRAYKAFKQCINNERNELWQYYKTLRNAVVNLLKEKKTKYYHDKIDKNINNPKKMWRTLKKLVNMKDNSVISCVQFEIEGEVKIFRDSMDIAENFNRYFVDSIDQIVVSIDVDIAWSNINYNLYLEFSEFSALTLRDLVELIRSLEAKSDIYEILNAKFIKEIVDSIGHVILHFVNTSLLYGRFPNKLKTSIVHPIQKITNTIKASEFRPINTLPTPEKILEMAVYDQLLRHFEKNHILISNQSGFRQKHSCETALQLTLTKFKNFIDLDNYVVAVFLDLRRAFETIDRDILIEKLKGYGIQGNVLNWIREYLSNRKQIVKVQDSFSSELYSKHGVPQGSILGPLLFIIYINDINLFIDCDLINLFADDTLLVCKGQNLMNTMDNMNIVLSKVNHYLNINKLKLNIDKTKAMILTSKFKYSKININYYNLSINGVPIEFVTEMKYLGFNIDNTLTFSSHFHYIYKKIFKKMYFFSRISHHISTSTKITVFNTIIKPHFEYCSTIMYLFDLNKISQLQKLQNRAMRIILKCNRFTPINTMLLTLEWLKVSDKLYLSAMIFIYKIVNKLQPSYFNEFIVFNHEIHGHLTRTRDNIYLSQVHKKKSMNSLFFKGIDQFNKLSPEIKNSPSVKLFKYKLIEHIKQR